MSLNYLHHFLLKYCNHKSEVLQGKLNRISEHILSFCPLFGKGNGNSQSPCKEELKEKCVLGDRRERTYTRGEII